MAIILALQDQNQQRAIFRLVLVLESKNEIRPTFKRFVNTFKSFPAMLSTHLAQEL